MRIARRVNHRHHARAAVVAVALAMISSAVAGAQSGETVGPGEPDRTEIVVPELFLEVEELSVEQVDALLPAGEDLELQSDMVPLPEPASVQVVDVSVDLPALPDPELSTGAPVSSVYSTGQLGAGTMNHVVGAISLYKLGEDPRFRLEFSHEGRDGFAFEPAGTGFFASTNLIEGWVGFGSDQWRVETEARYDERERGLQGVSDYYSADLRYLEGSAQVSYTPEPLVGITADARTALSTRLQSVSGGETAPRESEFFVAPHGQARLSISVVDLMLDVSYDGRWTTGTVIPAEQWVDATLGLLIELPNSLVIDGRAGAHWAIGDGLLYPWSVGVRLAPSANLEIAARGGYAVEEQRFNELWKSIPLLAVGESGGDPALENDRVWHSDAGVRWTGVSGLFVDTRARLEVRDNAVSVGPYDATADLFPYTQIRLVTLRPELLMGWQVNRAVQLEASWDGAFLGRTILDPISTVGMGIAMTSESERFGGSLDASMEIFPESVAMPRLDAEGFFQAGEGVEFVLRLHDGLAAFLPDGRPTIGTAVTAEYPFVEPGFSLSLLARISL